MRFFTWFQEVILGRRLLAQIRLERKRLLELDKQRKLSNRKMRAKLKELNAIKEELVAIDDSLSKVIKEAQATYRRYDERLEISTSKLKIMEEVTVPTLMQQNQTLLKMWEAETAIQIRRQVANQISVEE